MKLKKKGSSSQALKKGWNKLPWWLQVAVRSCLILFFTAVGLVLTQDIQIFPTLTGLGVTDRNFEHPPGLDISFLNTPDGEKLELWRYDAGTEKSRKAIVFHGNGGDVRVFFFMQKWLKNLGITSYSIDYRGYANSTGWPSEKNFQNDARLLVEHVASRDKISPEELIVVGFSIGTGVAAYTAEVFNPELLVLFAPYQSLPAIASEHPYLWWAAPFLWYEFPIAEHVSRLKRTGMILAHGVRDGIINYRHTEKIFPEYKGNGCSEKVISDNANHNNLHHLVKDQVGKLILKCLKDS